MKLNQLHEEFIDRARRPMNFDRLPIRVKQSDVVIVPVEKWTTTKDPARMRKTYKFSSMEHRNVFVKKLLSYEQKTQHNAVMTVEEGSVLLILYTKDVDQVTELDKEYAKFADLLFRDVVYSPPDAAK